MGTGKIVFVFIDKTRKISDE